MSERANPARDLDEVAYLFLSGIHPGPESEKQADLLEAWLEPSASDCREPLFASLFFSEAAPRPMAEEDRPGIILLDQEKFVTAIDRSAQALLGRREETYIGQLFDYFLIPDNAVTVSIIRHDRTMGMGEMLMGKNSLDGMFSYTVTVRDVTASRRKAGSTSAGTGCGTEEIFRQETVFTG